MGRAYIPHSCRKLELREGGTTSLQTFSWELKEFLETDQIESVEFTRNQTLPKDLLEPWDHTWFCTAILPQPCPSSLCPRGMRSIPSRRRLQCSPPALEQLSPSPIPSLSPSAAVPARQPPPESLGKACAFSKKRAASNSELHF